MEFKDLVGKTIRAIEVNRPDESDPDYRDDRIKFATDAGVFELYHSQDCCESVYIKDISGDLEDLIGTPILLAEEASQEDPNASESATWTFYKLRTIKGSVDISWYGESNGYYSEEVTFRKIEIRGQK